MDELNLSRGTKQTRAHNAVRDALKTGALVRKPCELCGEPKTHAHHDDYDRQLDVRWLCGSHHTLVHNALNAGRGADPKIRLGPTITSRRLREAIEQIERPVMVVRLRDGIYHPLGMWIPARPLDEEGP